jgi:hypothetical protein
LCAERVRHEQAGQCGSEQKNSAALMCVMTITAIGCSGHLWRQREMAAERVTGKLVGGRGLGSRAGCSADANQQR